MGHTVRAESGSIAEVSHLSYVFRSAKYDISNKNDNFPAMPLDYRKSHGFDSLRGKQIFSFSHAREMFSITTSFHREILRREGRPTYLVSRLAPY